MPKKVHYRSLRLYMNAGMSFPLCYSKAKVLDTSKSSLEVSGKLQDITCKHCLRMIGRLASFVTDWSKEDKQP